MPPILPVAATGSTQTVSRSSCPQDGHLKNRISAFGRCCSESVRKRCISAPHWQSGLSVEPGTNKLSNLDTRLPLRGCAHYAGNPRHTQCKTILRSPENGLGANPGVRGLWRTGKLLGVLAQRLLDLCAFVTGRSVRLHRMLLQSETPLGDRLFKPEGVQAGRQDLLKWVSCNPGTDQRGTH